MTKSVLVAKANTGSGTEEFVIDLIGTDIYPVMKLSLGDYNTAGGLVHSGNPLPALVTGAAADGAAVSGNPVLVAGQDGTNVQTLLTDTTGRLVNVGAAAAGAAISGNPVLMGGSDGTNARAVLTDTSGRQIMVGAAANAAAVTGNPVLVAGSDGTNAYRLLTGTDGRLSVNIAQMNGVTVSMNSGTNGTGVQRVTLATNDTLAGTRVVDNAAFTDGTTALQMDGFIFDETAGTALTENDAAAARVDSKRAQVVVIEDVTTRGTTVRATVKAASTAAAAADPALVVSISPNSVMNPVIRIAGTTITRPADTTAYASGDAYADSTSAPTAGGYTFTGAAKRSGLGGVILGMTVVDSNAPGTPIQGEVWVFNSAATAINDNAAFALSDADALLLIAKIPFVTFVEAANNSIASVPNLQIPYQCSGSADLRFLVRVTNAYTPASAETLNVILFVQQGD